jgi:hypothetical protein
VHFEIRHEFDIPLDALELAVIAPNLVERLATKLAEEKVGIESVAQVFRKLEDDILERTWHYQANVSIPSFAHGYVTRDMCAWDETSTYELARHAGHWTIVPNVKPEWRKYFGASGTYALTALGGGRSERLVSGNIELDVRVVRQVGERLIVNLVKKIFDAEASTLREMATLI